MRIFIALCACALFANVSAAQNQSGRARIGDPPIVPHGTLHPIVDYVPPPPSLAALVKTADVIVDDLQELPLLPGDAMQVRNNTVNQFVSGIVWWRERALEDSERT